MNNSLINSVSALNGLQKRIDMIANNIANVNTMGYKRKEASFQDILTTYKQQTEDMQLPGRLTPLGLTEGWGARLTRQMVDLSQGVLLNTNNPLDLAIQGDALFELAVPRMDENGEPLLDPATGEQLFDTTWTRQGAFNLTAVPGDDENVYLAAEDGTILVTGAAGEQIAIPRNHNVVIDQNGQVIAVNNNDERTVVGQLRLAKVLNPQLLIGIGDHRFAIAEDVPVDSVIQRLDTAEQVALEDVGVRQGFLEQSNVNIAKEMTELMSVQRAFQMSSRALASADTMMDLANNLRRS